MKNKIIQEQLAKVEYADLSKFDPETNSYFIKKRVDIKLEEDNCYLIHLKDSLFNNQTLMINWNNNNMPKDRYLKIDISKIMPKMIKVVGVGYNIATNQDLGNFWSGWLQIDQIDVIQKL